MTDRHAIPQSPALGSAVLVLGPYCSETRDRGVDAWTGRTLHVRAIRRDDVLLSQEPDGEGDVWIYAGRLVAAT